VHAPANAVAADTPARLGRCRMSVRWEGEEALLQPIAPDKPCGEDLEDTELLSSFDTYRLFGQPRPLDAPSEPDEKRIPKLLESPEIRDKAREALGKSKDLRLLAYLGAALLRTDGVPGFAASLNVASEWLATQWRQTYPLVDEDAVLRRNALNCFADPMAVVDGLRRVPLVRSRQHGTFSLRDIEIATRQIVAGNDDRQVDENQVNAAFASLPLVELTQLHDDVVGAVASLHKIDATMREASGADATPSFDQLTGQLVKMSQLLRGRLAAHPDRIAVPPSDSESAAEADARTGLSSSVVVRSRQDAIVALDAVAAFFRQSEPSSPIPLFLERAKRLVSKDFLEVLADIAPAAVAQARAAGGLKEGE
jgi:type VI secretion system protein ImpA